MRRILIAAAGIVAMVLSADAQEHLQSGNDLVEACRVIANGSAPTPNNAFQAGICLGQIEALNWVAPGIAGESIRACVPQNITRQQMAKVVVTYFDQNTDRLREPFEGLALEALALTWPCHEERGWFERWWNRKSSAE